MRLIQQVPDAVRQRHAVRDVTITLPEEVVDALKERDTHRAAFCCAKCERTTRSFESGSLRLAECNIGVVRILE